MGITFSAIERLLAWVQELIGSGRSAPARPGGSASRTAAHWPGAIHHAPRNCTPWHPVPVRCRNEARPSLRVVRVLDGCQAPAGSGRMIISGRMSDVCAELERLAALEARAG